MHINSLRLLNFRSHCDFQISDIKPFVQIIGPNGSGKTNILESISLLSPGRGFHGRQFDEMLSTHQNIYKEWSVSAELSNDVNIVTGATITNGHVKRVSYIDGEKVRKQWDLLQAIRVIWLTPQMDDLFIAPSVNRRKFIDRITYTFQPEHANNIAKYEHFMRSRLKLLLDGRYDQIWLQQMERKMADYAYTIFNARSQVIQIMQDILKQEQSLFISPDIRLTDCAEIDIEKINQTLYDNRILDAKKGRTHYGPHKTDLITTHPIKQRPAVQCSTGEQKAMLIAIIIAQARGINQQCHHAPIVLLDEVFTHLDRLVQKNLLDALHSFEAQTWMTATEHDCQMEQETVITLK